MKTIQTAIAAMMSVMFMSTFTTTFASVPTAPISPQDTVQATVPIATQDTVQAESQTPSRRPINIDLTDRVEPHTTDVYNMFFFRGEPVVINLIGDGDTDLELYVYDKEGNCVYGEDDIMECCYDFTPRWNGYFKITIKNLGNVYNRYHLRIRQ